jgi:hypothetical protein
MKPLLILFTLLFFIIDSAGFAQDLRFYFEVTTVTTTTEVKVFVRHKDISGVENLAGYTVYFYYDNTETTVTGYDSSPTSIDLGWAANNETSIFHRPSSNGDIGIVHTGYFFFQTFDNELLGDNITNVPVHLLTINFDNSVGSSGGGEGWLAGTAEEPALRYVGSDFTGHDVIIEPPGGQPLPIELTDFQAKSVDNRHAELTWQTATEINSSHFLLERSDDGKTWIDIGQVAAAGYSTTLLTYHYLDRNVYRSGSKPDRFYYRLNMVDQDQTFEYSPMRTVSFTAGSELVVRVFPNPFNRQSPLFVDLQGDHDGPVHLKLSDSFGRAVLQRTLILQGNQRFAVPLPRTLPAGVYWLELFNRKGTLDRRQVVVMD